MWISRLLFFGALLGATAPALAQPAARDLSLPQLLVQSVEVPDPSSLAVSIASDRDDGEYRVGEAIRLSVTANKAAYFEVVAIGPTGNAVQIYPNAFQPTERIAAGAILEIPGTDGRSELVAALPAGLELIRVVASTAPFAELPAQDRTATGPFQVISGGAEIVARDLQQRVLTSRDEIAFGDTYVVTVDGSDTLVPPEPEDLSIPIPTEGPPPPRAPLLALDRQQYRIGDRLQIAVTSFDECHLWVVNVSADGSARLIFPNRLVRANLVRAGGTVIVSGGPSPVDVVASGPAGLETIHALCSREATPPWRDGLDFAQLFPGLPIDRGIGRALSAVEPEEAGDTASRYGWARTTINVVTAPAD